MITDNFKNRKAGKKTDMLKKIGVVSLGCSKNTVDTEEMLGELVSYGFEIVSDASEAEIIIVNTCGFIESAKTDSLDTILEMAEYKKNGKCKLLAVTGCLSQRYPDELPPELPEVDLFWGVKNYPAFAKKLAEICGRTRVCGAVPERVLTTPPFRAYLRIADGCDNRCTYCAIPLIRGGRVSIPMEKLIEEAKGLAKRGVTELTVIAQDTSAYGIDLYGEPRLAQLLTELAKIDGFHWIRLLYTYPNTVNEELIDTIRDNPKLCNYIDMPIQHISVKMLENMNRHGSAEHIRHIVDYIRKSAPDFILRTTVMLGFPSETEEDFNELMEFIEEHPFDRIGAFTFSPEDGTKAFDMPDQIDHETAQRRFDTLMRRQMEISYGFNKKRIGTTVEALVEAVEGDCAYCRSYAEAADVDGLIKIKLNGNENVKAGNYVQVKITSADYYDLNGELI